MKPMIAAGIAIILIAVGANMVLEHAGFSARQQTTGADVRSG